MAHIITIEWIYGRPEVGADQDEARAANAAEAVLDEARVDYADAEAALTEGWHDPGGAACEIVAH